MGLHRRGTAQKAQPSFGAFEDDIARFSQRLKAMGIKQLDPPPGIDSNGIWFRDHDENLVEIKVAAKSSPDEKSKFGIRSAGPGKRDAPFRSTMGRTRPRRLAHILMFTRDVSKAIEIYKSSACFCPVTRAITSRFCTASTEAIIT